MKSLFKKSEFPHVNNLKNASGSPEIRTASGGASTRKIRSAPGGESVMRLRLGSRLVNLLPLAQRIETFTHFQTLRIVDEKLSDMNEPTVTFGGIDIHRWCVAMVLQ